jgi:hypothetical protein
VGNPHATCDVAGAGNKLTLRLVRHSQSKGGKQIRRTFGATAPVLDPTDKGDCGATQALKCSEVDRAGVPRARNHCHFCKVESDGHEKVGVNACVSESRYLVI